MQDLLEWRVTSVRNTALALCIIGAVFYKRQGGTVKISSSPFIPPEKQDWAECVRALIAAGASPLARNIAGKTPFSYCVGTMANQETLELARVMLNAYEKKVMEDAMASGQAKSVAEAKGKAERKQVVNSIDRFGETCLHSAVTAMCSALDDALDSVRLLAVEEGGRSDIAEYLRGFTAR